MHFALRGLLLSRRNAAWRLVRTRYDDGGFSGGTLERPALKQLLADIQQRNHAGMQEIRARAQQRSVRNARLVGSRSAREGQPWRIGHRGRGRQDGVASDLARGSGPRAARESRRPGNGRRSRRNRASHPNISKATRQCIDADCPAADSGLEERQPNATLVKAIARGHVWAHKLVTGEVRSLRALGELVGVSERYVSRIVRLGFLEPALVEAILNGRHPKQRALDSLWNPPLGWKHSNFSGAAA